VLRHHQISLNKLTAKVLWDDFALEATMIGDAESTAIAMPTNDVTAFILQNLIDLQAN